MRLKFNSVLYLEDKADINIYKIVFEYQVRGK